MFTQYEYMWGWIYYLIGAVLLYISIWFSANKLPLKELRYALRILSAVILFLPWSTNPQQEYLSPAWVVAGLEGVFEGPKAFWRAGFPLIFSVALSTVVCVLIVLFLRIRAKKQAAKG